MANAAGMIAKYFATSLAILKVVSAPRVINNCLPISTISMSFVGLESRSTRLPASLAACVPGVHRHGDVSLSQCRSIVRAIARHRDEPPAGLHVANELELGFRRGLRQEIVHAGLSRYRRRSLRVISGDHHGLDAHASQLSESFLDPALYNIFESNDAQHFWPFRYDQRCPALNADGIHARPDSSRELSLARHDVGLDGVGRALSDIATVKIHSAHAGLRRKRDERGTQLVNVART